VTIYMQDAGTGQSNGTALDTAKWVTQGTSSGGASATYQSEAMRFSSGNAGGYAGTNRVTRNFNYTYTADGVITFDYTIDANEPYGLVAWRATTSGVDYPSGYFLSLTKSWAAKIIKSVSYSATDLVTSSFTHTAGTLYHGEINVTGSTFNVYLWADGGSKPGTPTLSSTGDTTFTGAGTWGISVAAGNAAVNHSITFDNVVVSDGAGTVDVSLSDTVTVTDALAVGAAVPLGDDPVTVTDTGLTLEQLAYVTPDGDTAAVGDAMSVQVFQLRHDLKVEVEFTPDEWTDITDRLIGEQEAQATFGRPTRFDDVAASTFTAQFRNADGALTPGNPNSPWFPNVEKGRALRAALVWAGQEYPIFWGQIAGITLPAIVSAAEATVTINCTDVMAALERKVLLSPFVEESRRVARNASNGACDVFPFPPSVVKTETSVQVADTSFENKGILGSGSSRLGTCFVVPAANDGGTVKSSSPDSEGGALTEGVLTFEVGDNGFGRQTHPVVVVQPQPGFQQFEMLFQVPTGVLPPIYATGTHTVTAGGNGWNTIRDTYGLTFDELRLLNPELPDLSALAVGQVVNVATDGKAGSEWVLAQFFAGSTEMLRVCLTNNAGKMSLITRNPSTGGAAYVWSGPTLADGKWRKLTVYRSAQDQVRSNINDSPSGSNTTGLPADLTEVTTVYVGGRMASATAATGTQTQCPEFALGGLSFQRTGGVWSYYVLGAPPANITAASRFTELAQYAHPVPVQVASHHHPSIENPFTTQVVRTPTTGRTVLECMQELARTVGGYLWVEPATGILTMRKGPASPLTYVPVDLIADADASSPPQWRNTVDSQPTRAIARCPAGEATAVNAAAETGGVYRQVEIDTCAATVSVAKSVADRYVGGSDTLHLTDLQVDLVHAENDLWAHVLNSSFLPTEAALRITNTVPEVLGYDTIEAVVESWTLSSTVESATFHFETTPTAAFSSPPSLADVTVSSSVGTQTDGTVTAQRPSGLSNGDFLVAVLTCDETGSLGALSALSGEWALRSAGGSSAAGFGKVWTKRAGTSEPTAYQFSVAGYVSGGGSPTLMADDFTGTNGASLDAAKWTNGEVRTGASATLLDGTAVLNPGTNTGYNGRVSVLADVTDRADVGLVTSFKFGDGDSYLWAVLRGDAGGLAQNGYEIRPRAGTAGTRVASLSNYTATQLGNISGTLNAGTWYRLRFEAVGTTVRARVWPAGSAEPSSWQVSVTNSAITSAGTVHLVAGGGNTAAARVYLDDVQVYDPTATTTGGSTTYPEAHLTVMRATNIDATDPILVSPTWDDDAAATTGHDAPSITLPEPGVLVSHWHVLTGSSTTGGGGSGSASGFAFGISGFDGMTAAATDAEIAAVNAWLTSGSVAAVGHWADADATVQQAQWGIGSGERFGNWTGIIDIAFGGVFGSETWAQAASGTFDSRWQTGLSAIATKWGARDKAKLHIRFAHEFNGGTWSDWHVAAGDENNFKAAWIRWANMFRATLPGAQIVWSPNYGTGAGMASVEACWPGSAYVDVVGPDVYNAWPHVTDAAGYANQTNKTDAAGNPVGPEKWRQWALAKGKPVCFPEWGNPAVDTGGGAGGGDNPYFASAFLAWCKANGGSGAGQVKYAIYFSIGVPDYAADYEVFPTTRQPNVAAAVKGGA